MPTATTEPSPLIYSAADTASGSISAPTIAAATFESCNRRRELTNLTRAPFASEAIGRLPAAVSPSAEARESVSAPPIEPAASREELLEIADHGGLLAALWR